MNKRIKKKKFKKRFQENIDKAFAYTNKFVAGKITYEEWECELRNLKL